MLIRDSYVQIKDDNGFIYAFDYTLSKAIRFNELLGEDGPCLELKSCNVSIRLFNLLHRKRKARDMLIDNKEVTVQIKGSDEYVYGFNPKVNKALRFKELLGEDGPCVILPFPNVSLGMITKYLSRRNMLNDNNKRY